MIPSGSVSKMTWLSRKLGFKAPAKPQVKTRRGVNLLRTSRNFRAAFSDPIPEISTRVFGPGEKYRASSRTAKQTRLAAVSIGPKRGLMGELGGIHGPGFLLGGQQMVIGGQREQWPAIPVHI